MKNCTLCDKPLTAGIPHTLAFGSQRKHHLICKDCHAAECRQWREHYQVERPGFTWGESECRACGQTLAYTISNEYPQNATAPEWCDPKCRAKLRRREREGVEHDPKPCEYCGESFTPKRATARFCSDKCRVYHSREASGAGRVCRKSTPNFVRNRP